MAKTLTLREWMPDLDWKANAWLDPDKPIEVPARAALVKQTRKPISEIIA